MVGAVPRRRDRNRSRVEPAAFRRGARAAVFAGPLRSLPRHLRHHFTIVQGEIVCRLRRLLNHLRLRRFRIAPSAARRRRLRPSSSSSSCPRRSGLCGLRFLFDLVLGPFLQHRAPGSAGWSTKPPPRPGHQRAAVRAGRRVGSACRRVPSTLGDRSASRVAPANPRSFWLRI